MGLRTHALDQRRYPREAGFQDAVKAPNRDAFDPAHHVGIMIKMQAHGNVTNVC